MHHIHPLNQPREGDREEKNQILYQINSRIDFPAVQIQTNLIDFPAFAYCYPQFDRKIEQMQNSD